jgi:hypothetical protein
MILSDGKSDGVVLMYAKNGVLYPVALTEEQASMLSLTIGLSLNGKLNVISDKPQGNMISLINSKM